jgi:hypothetical protein
VSVSFRWGIPGVYHDALLPLFFESTWKLIENLTIGQPWPYFYMYCTSVNMGKKLTEKVGVDAGDIF